MHALPAGRRVGWLQLSVCQSFLHSLSSGDSGRTRRGGSSSAMEIKGRKSTSAHKTKMLVRLLCKFVFFCDVLAFAGLTFGQGEQRLAGSAEGRVSSRSSLISSWKQFAASNCIAERDSLLLSAHTLCVEQRKTGGACLTVSFLPALNVYI